MIAVHILIFSSLLYLAVKIHGNNFLNTVALSVVIGMLCFLMPAIFYVYDNKYINNHVENGFLDINLLFYIESYFLAFILFSAKFYKIPAYQFNITRSNIYPALYIIFSLITFKYGSYYLDVTNSAINNNKFISYSLALRGIFFILGLYVLTANKSKYTVYFILYYIIYTSFSGSKGGILFALSFIVIYYFQDKKMFSFKSIKYYVLVFLTVPFLFYSVTMYRAIYQFKGDGKRADLSQTSYIKLAKLASDNFDIVDVYSQILTRADNISVMQMAYNQYNDDDFLLGSVYEIIPNHFLPSVLFPEKVKFQKYYGTQLTEKIWGAKVGNTVIGLSPPVEAYINFYFFGFLVGIVHGLIYNVLFQLLKNKRDNNFMIAYFSILFFILSDGFLSTSLAIMLKDLVYLVIISSTITFLVPRKKIRLY